MNPIMFLYLIIIAYSIRGIPNTVIKFIGVMTNTPVTQNGGGRFADAVWYILILYAMHYNDLFSFLKGIN